MAFLLFTVKQIDNSPSLNVVSEFLEEFVTSKETVFRFPVPDIAHGEMEIDPQFSEDGIAFKYMELRRIAELAMSHPDITAAVAFNDISELRGADIPKDADVLGVSLLLTCFEEVDFAGAV